MDELKCAVDMFCAFIDRNTYALFYYNGHAIGHGNDVYLVSKDTNLKVKIRLYVNKYFYQCLQMSLRNAIFNCFFVSG